MKARAVARFFKRNIYYLLLIVCIAVIATIVALTLVNANREPIADVNTPPIVDGGGDAEEPGTNPDPTPVQIIFDAPVRTGEIGMDYSETDLVFHLTLGDSRTHRGIDFMAEAGTEVYAAYEGTVESISAGVLYGTVITIDHGDGLKTVYKSLGSETKVEVGDRVRKGDIIGTVSDTMGIEHAEGAHLHFEVTKAGLLVDPYTYLLSSGK